MQLLRTLRQKRTTEQNRTEADGNRSDGLTQVCAMDRWIDRLKEEIEQKEGKRWKWVEAGERGGNGGGGGLDIKKSERGFRNKDSYR